MEKTMPRSNILTPNQYDPNFSVPNNVLTLKVDPTITPSISVKLSDGTQIRCLNVIGAGAIKIQSASLAVNQQLLILNTQGSKPIFISLDNGGLVAGVATYPLGSGSNVSVIFDGTNLNQQS
jgi:hypothetical protein